MWAYDAYRKKVALPQLRQLPGAPMHNPFRKSNWNLTLQFELMKKDPAAAERLRQLAAAE